MKIKNWVPQSDIISYYNVPDEDLSVLWTESIEHIIKAIYSYYQRSVFTQMFPWNNISLILNKINPEYISYLEYITWKILTDDNFLTIKWKQINQIAKMIPNRINLSFLPFIAIKTDQELGLILNNKWIYIPNLAKEKDVELAN